MSVKTHIKVGPGDVGAKDGQEIQDGQSGGSGQVGPALRGTFQIEASGILPLVSDHLLKFGRIDLVLSRNQHDEQRQATRRSFFTRLPEEIAADPIPFLYVRRRLGGSQILVDMERVALDLAKPGAEPVPGIP